MVDAAAVEGALPTAGLPAAVLETPVPDAVPPTSREQALVRWEPDRTELFSTMVHNGLRLIPTLGLYRFWARTNIRRVLWSFTQVGQHPLVYTGRGMELFVGFLLALLALGPGLGLFNFVLALVVVSDNVIISSMVPQALSVAAVFMLGIVGRFFARRYLLTRTAWRKVHAGQSLKLWDWFRRHLVGYALIVATLGLAMPRVQAQLHNYRMGGTWLGTARFEAAATSEGLWRPWLAVWGLMLTFCAASAAWWDAPVIILDGAAHAAADPSAASAAWAPTVFFTLVVLIPAAWLYYSLVKFRRFTAATRLEGVTFACPIPLRRVAHVPVVYALLMALVIGACAAPFILLASQPPTLFGAVLPLVALVLFFAGYNLATTLWWRVELYKAITKHLEVRGLEQLDDMLNKGDPGPGRGEGMADALGDVGF